MTHEQKQYIRDQLQRYDIEPDRRLRFVRWMIRIFKAA